MRRREFIAFLGGAAAWPLGTGAQQPAIPVIGFLSGRSSNESRYLVAAFENGLREVGFVGGRDVAIEFHWADGQYDRLPGQAADLVRRQVAVIVALGGTPAILAAKAATSTIPLVFVSGDDPIRLGLVASLNRPGGNVTGASPLNPQLGAKRLDILHELVPKTVAIGLLVNPKALMADMQLEAAEAAARALGRQLHVLMAADADEIDGAFASLAQRGDGALMLSGDPFFNSRRDQLVALAARHKIPALYHTREIAVAGGLMSYGASVEDSYRQAGVYAGRILKGEKPGDLPVLQPTKFELVINLKTAKALGLEIPPMLLFRADEVIE
jgi:putative tryptophan/tyrosine transport system substrate-binding protein